MVQMEYEAYDTDGTDDDLPSAHIAVNGRSNVHDMETQIHRLEQEAYAAVLRAFKAQSDAITWDKEGLITDLRKELRVSDDEHRELLTSVNSEDIIQNIREWRLAGGNQMNIAPSPAPRKKQKTSQSIPSGDILWDEEHLEIAPQERYSGRSSGFKKSQSFGRGGGLLKNQSRNELLPPQNGIGKKVLDNIELLNTDALVKEVEKVFSSNKLDPSELEKAKKMLREHEQALVDAIAKLAYVSGGESEEEKPNGTEWS